LFGAVSVTVTTPAATLTVAELGVTNAVYAVPDVPPGESISEFARDNFIDAELVAAWAG
jgi:hypothetical protein